MILQLSQELRTVCKLIISYEVVTKKEDFYKIKTVFEKKIDNISYSAIEWRASNSLNFDKERSKKINEVLNRFRRNR